MKHDYTLNSASSTHTTPTAPQSTNTKHHLSMQNNTSSATSTPRRSSHLSMSKLATILLLLVATVMPSLLNAQTPSATICLGETKKIVVTVDGTNHGTPGYKFEWKASTAGSGHESDSIRDRRNTCTTLTPACMKDSLMVTPTQAGTYEYRVIITDKNGCTHVKQATIIVNPLPTPSITAVPTQCPNVGSVTITAGNIATSPSYIYTWGGDLVVSSTNPQTSSENSDRTATVNIPSGNCNTSYTVSLTVKDGNECSASTTTTVTVLDNVAPEIGTIGTRDTVDAVDAGTCKYKIPDLESTVVAASSDGCGGAITWVSQSPAKDTPYTQIGSVQYIDVTVTVKDGCNIPTSKVVRVRIPANTFSVNTIDSTYICGGGNALRSRTLTTTPTNNNGDVTWSWTPAANVNNASYHSPSTQNLSSTTRFVVTATDANGCVAKDSVKITVSPAIVPNININPNPICEGESVTISSTPSGGSGTYTTYAWTTTTGTSTIVNAAAASTSARPTSTGTVTYEVVVTDDQGCNNTASQSVTVTPLPTFYKSVSQHVSCFDGNDGILNISNVPGNPTSIYYSLDGGAYASLAGGAATPRVYALTGLGAGTHTITIKTAADGCESASQTFVINQPPAITVVSKAKTQPTCNGYDNGQMVITVTGGTLVSTTVAPYYSTVTLNGNAPTSSSKDGDNYIFTFTGLSASNTHTLYITDKNDCELSTDTIKLGEPTAVTVAAITPSATTVCSGTAVTLSSQTATGGTPGVSPAPAYTYAWTASAGSAPATTTPTAPAVTAATHTPTATTTPVTVTYTLTATDANGCTGDNTVNVTVNPLPTVAISPDATQNVCLNTDITSMTVTGSNGAVTVTGLPAGVSYNSSTGVISGRPTEPGTFAVTATCTSQYTPSCTPAATATMTLKVYDAVDVTAADQSAQYCIGATAAELTATYTGGNGSYTYEWISISGTDTTHNVASTAAYTPSTASAGTLTYAVIVKNACNNDTANVATIQVYDAYSLTNDNRDTTYCLNATAEALTVTVAGGSEATYQWYANGTAIAGATTGSYTPVTSSPSTDTTYTVKVGNGCQSDSVVVARVQVWTLPTVNVTSISRDRVACMADTTAAVSDTNALAAIGFHFANGHNISQNVTVVSNSFTGDNCFGTRTTVYRATDECGNSVDVTYIQTVKDSIAPVKTGSWPTGDDSQNNCLASADLSVFLSDAEAKAQYSDCSEMTVTHEQDTTGDNCGWTVRRMYVITDQCGNTSYDTIKVSGMNTVLPTITTIDDQDAIIAMGNCQYKIPNLNELTLEHSSDICGGTMSFVSQLPAADSLFDQTTSEQVIPVTVTVANECGLQQTATVNVIIPANDIQLTATDTAYICLGDSATLTAVGGSSNGGVTYGWTPATGLNTTTGNNVMASPSTDMTYTVRATDRNGCFLEQEVMVMIYPSLVLSADSLNQHVCAGGAMAPVTVNYAHATVAVTGLPNGITYDAASGVISGHPHEDGDYMIVATHVNGCGTDTLYGSIMVNDTIMVHETDTACDTYTWAANGLQYTTSGRYRFGTQTAAGCDSVMYVNLTVNYSNTGDTSAVVCEPFTWYGTTYDESGEPTHVLTNQDGCDSTVTLHLTVGQRYLIAETDSMCDGGVYEWHGMHLTSASSEAHPYTQTYPSIYGCDSVYSLVLTVKPRVTLSIERIADCEMSQYVIIAETNADFIEWSSSNDDGQIDAQIHNDTIRVAPPETTTYTVVADRPGTHFCMQTESITVNELLIPTARIDVGDQHISPDDAGWHAEDVSENGGFGREWYVNGEYYFEQGQTIQGTISPETSETAISIRLIAFSEFCSDTAEAEIPIVIEPIYVPNIFTPGENTNNLFGPEGDVITECEMWVYSREGLLVFHSTSKDEKWDGTHQGKGTKCKQAAYTYKVRYKVKGQDTVHQKFGTVTVMW